MIIHDVIGKRKISLDQIRKGLQILGLLDDLQKYPSFYEVLFTAQNVTPMAIIASFTYEPKDIEQSIVVSYLKEFLVGCDQEILEKFLIFITATKSLPSSIRIRMEASNAITARACFNILVLLISFDGKEHFNTAMLASIGCSGRSFTSI